MKKFLLAIVVLISSYANAQQEVRVDLTDALVMKSLEVSYEYYMSEQSSVGLSALFNFEKQTADFRYNENTMITPYFRHYFTANRNWNYFGEIFLGINSGKKEVVKDTFVKYTDGALGVSVGTKYVSDGGFVVSAHAGVGRNMFSDLSPILAPRLGLAVGYRF